MENIIYQLITKTVIVCLEFGKLKNYYCNKGPSVRKIALKISEIEHFA